MSLSDIMSAAGLTSWAEIALILCFVTFMLIVVWVFGVRRKASYEHLSELPLDDEEGCQVRRFRRFARTPRYDVRRFSSKSSESSDLAPPREFS